MDIAALVNRILPVFDDAAFSAWCTEHLGGQPNVFVGVDDANPPSKADYPVVAITAIRPQTDNPPGRYVFGVDIACGVVDETISVSGEGDRVRVYNGFILAEAMRGQLMGALRRMAGLGKVSVADAGENAVHPLYISAAEATVEIIASGRR